MSFTATLFPIIAALSAPEGSFFNIHNEWMCCNDKQTCFIENFFSKKVELSQFNQKELQAWVSKDHKELNNIAHSNGFQIEFEPFNEFEFGSLSLLNVSVQWEEEGIVTSIEHQNAVYKAVGLKNNFCVIKTVDDQHPIIKIKTKSNDLVYMTLADESLQDFALLQKIGELQKYVEKAFIDDSYDTVVFPHVLLDQIVDISWLLTMKCPDKNGGKKWSISQAKQQTKFAMDEKGAHVESAVAVAFSKAFKMPKQQLVIDKPFYVWIERSGCSMPVFAGYIDTQDWVKANSIA